MTSKVSIPAIAFIGLTLCFSCLSVASASIGLVSVTITSSESDPTNVSPIPITFTFGEAVSNFDQGDITPTNGSLSNFMTVSSSEYTVDITPALDGSVQVDIAEGAGVGDVSSDDTEADSFSIVYDGTAPTPTISTATNPTNTSPIPVTVMFDEAVQNFSDGGVTVGNGNVSNFMGTGDTYTFDVTPIAEGEVTVDVAAMVANDLAGNDNVAASQLSIDYDIAGPIPVLTFTIVGSVIEVTVDFGEPVTGFDQTDVVITNGTLANFAGADAVYTFDILSPTGPITVTIAEAAGQDLAMNDTLEAMPSFTAPSLPDLRLGTRAALGSHKGDNNYSQVILRERNVSGKFTFFVSFENDGISGDEFGARSKKSKSFRVTYRGRGIGNVTSALQSGRLSVNLGSGEIQLIKAQLRPKKGARTFRDLVRLFDQDSSENDRGKVQVRYRREVSSPASGATGITPGTVGGSISP